MVIPCKAAATCISDNIGKNSVTELPRDLSVRSSRTYRCTRTLTYTDRYHIPRVLTDKGNRSRFFGLTWSLEQTYQLIVLDWEVRFRMEATTKSTRTHTFT